MLTVVSYKLREHLTLNGVLKSRKHGIIVVIVAAAAVVVVIIINLKMYCNVSLISVFTLIFSTTMP
jgi:hypothetical protein